MALIHRERNKIIIVHEEVILQEYVKKVALGKSIPMDAKSIIAHYCKINKATLALKFMTVSSRKLLPEWPFCFRIGKSLQLYYNKKDAP